MPLQGHSYRTWCDLRKGAATSLVTVEYGTHTREEAEGNERVPSGYEFATLQAKLSELDFIFLNRFIQVGLQPQYSIMIEAASLQQTHPQLSGCA